MGKWTCICGQNMNDHLVPDPNCYRTYSEPAWDSIQTDADGNLNYYDIPDPAYDVYVCPNCGRLMVFDDGNRCTFYKPEETE